MRVGLCTCYVTRNYGSMLQALASELAIRQLGHDVEMVRYIKDYTLLQKAKQVPRVLNGGNIRNLRRRLERRRMSALYPEIAARRSKRDTVFDCFCERNFRSLSEEFVGFEALREGSKRYGAVVAGSDQLWLPAGLPTNFYNLQFAAEGVRRVSYATSFGVSAIPWYQRGRTADYLRKIEHLSVREESGAQICREISGVEAKVVVDPTLLLTAGEWERALEDTRPVEEGYIFCYILGDNPRCREQANALAACTGLPIVTIPHLDDILPSDEGFGDHALYDVDPAGFVGLIRHAEYVLTDSFHGTVFSTLNHKRFQTFYRFAQSDGQSRNSRVDSLLGRLHLESRLNCEGGVAVDAIDEPIDFDEVDEMLAAWRTDSWQFLEEALVD